MKQGQLFAGVAASLLLIMSTDTKASEMSGQVEFGGQINSVSETDNNFDGTARGFYGSAFAQMDFESSSLTFDLQGEAFQTDTYEEAPRGAAVLGSHYLWNRGPSKFGLFAAYGIAPDYNNTEHGGHQVGAEWEYSVSDVTALFVQGSYANVRVDHSDSGFTGWYTRVGYRHAFSESHALLIDAGHGYANDNFEDSGDSGRIRNATIEYTFKLPTDKPLYGVLGYEYGRYIANTEDDGTTHGLRFGIVIPFGDSTAYSTQHSLATPITPYRAASWGETLD